MAQHHVSLKRFDFLSTDDLVLKSSKSGRDAIGDLAAVEQRLDSRRTAIYGRFGQLGKHDTRLTGFSVSDRNNLFKRQAFAVDDDLGGHKQCEINTKCANDLGDDGSL